MGWRFYVLAPEIMMNRFRRVVTSDGGVTRGDGAAVAAAAVAAGGLGVLGCVRDNERLVSGLEPYDTLSVGDGAG